MKERSSRNEIHGRRYTQPRLPVRQNCYNVGFGRQMYLELRVELSHMTVSTGLG